MTIKSEEFQHLLDNYCEAPGVAAIVHFKVLTDYIDNKIKEARAEEE